MLQPVGVPATLLKPIASSQQSVVLAGFVRHTCVEIELGQGQLPIQLCGPRALPTAVSNHRLLYATLLAQLHATACCCSGTGFGVYFQRISGAKAVIEVAAARADNRVCGVCERPPGAAAFHTRVFFGCRVEFQGAGIASRVVCHLPCASRL
jgi:hypothetical protein